MGNIGNKYDVTRLCIPVLLVYPGRSSSIILLSNVEMSQKAVGLMKKYSG
jgi:hypothetical protein